MISADGRFVAYDSSAGQPRPGRHQPCLGHAAHPGSRRPRGASALLAGGGKRRRGETQRYIGYWALPSDGSTADLTDQAAWASADPGVAIINAAGLANGQSAWGVHTTITATSGGRSDTASCRSPRPPSRT